jgi:hypothetical protein
MGYEEAGQVSSGEQQLQYERIKMEPYGIIWRELKLPMDPEDFPPKYR